MQVICVSRGSLDRGKQLAELLANNLGYQCLGREDLVEAAIAEGIQVGKLEMAMLKPQAFTERLAAEREHYLAFCRTYLCDRAIDGRIVYHGRTGHLLLPGIRHVLRVRVVADMEDRIKSVQNRLGLERKKARNYVEEVDEGRRRWAKSMYGVAIEEVVNYDFIINLTQVSISNGASALTGMAQLPDFQMTPASKKAMLDLRLGSKARVLLARDERTHQATFKVRADGGIVTVTYLPQDARLADSVQDVLRPLADASELRVTMAATNILWIQEEYSPDSETYSDVVEIAQKWNAAVELMRLAPKGEEPLHAASGLAAPSAIAESALPREYDGGIEDDTPDVIQDNGGLKPTLDALAGIGRSGGGSAVSGDQQQLVDVIDRNVPYTLVVIGDVFLSKGHSARLRATRDLRSFLSDQVKAPVITADELGRQYLFGKRDAVRTLVFVAILVVVYALVFTQQDAILAFLANSGWYADSMENTFLADFGWMHKVIIAAAVFLVVPVVAYTYGTVAGTILKLIKME